MKVMLLEAASSSFLLLERSQYVMLRTEPIGACATTPMETQYMSGIHTTLCQAIRLQMSHKLSFTELTRMVLIDILPLKRIMPEKHSNQNDLHTSISLNLV